MTAAIPRFKSPAISPGDVLSHDGSRCVVEAVGEKIWIRAFGSRELVPVTPEQLRVTQPTEDSWTQ